MTTQLVHEEANFNQAHVMQQQVSLSLCHLPF